MNMMSFDDQSGNEIEKLCFSEQIIWFGWVFVFQKQTAQKTVSLDEARAIVKAVAYDGEPSNRQNGEIVYITARLVTDEPLTEPDYNIQVQAVKLKRQVQMYQWIEEETYVAAINEHLVRPQNDVTVLI